ncbi:MAE_28990/MAE_18760 family HEPN-like nuclease [Varibaculum cambriense]|uniref:MAE_28990/MAE_18760 family HEPN-like nuclease n=1 Tax=Varibaculum cambriense TaxID=184870 RepID=UPI0039F5E637
MEIAHNVFHERKDELNEALDTITKLGKETPPNRQLLVTLRAATLVMEYTWIEATVTEVVRAVIRKVKNDQVRTENLNQSIQRRFLVAQTADRMPNLEKLAKFTTKIQRLSAYLDGEAIPPESSSPPPAHVKSLMSDSGNIDHKAIKKICKYLDLDFEKKIHEHYTEQKALTRAQECLTGLKNDRNQLTHGEVSFEKLGSNRTKKDLTDTFRIIDDYLYAILDIFNDYLENQEYLNSKH